MKCTFKTFFVWEKVDTKYYRGLLFFWGGGGGGEVCMSLVWISKATVLCIEEEQGQIQDFLMEGDWYQFLLATELYIYLF